MIELKLGRPCIVWNKNQPERKGIYIKAHKLSGEIYVLDEYDNLGWYEHVKPDLDATPMNGDEVECRITGQSTFYCKGRYVEQRGDGLHGVEVDGDISYWDQVRFPQPSKRERVEEFLNSYYYPCNAEKIANEIDKIYTEDD